ncbi:hypothetical protein IJ22_19590 [Paenibacillus naphthalenovorans]|uniref:Uncharacterized protein n=1 Tax=Paenibacillus naphthalenovorans TaxID=162209 RepID=A0A0U2W4J2_9BACL|nr:hypothetical protein IJ22_19590 [Paenibacillus naphthalenovorans]
MFLVNTKGGRLKPYGCRIYGKLEGEHELSISVKNNLYVVSILYYRHYI